MIFGSESALARFNITVIFVMTRVSVQLVENSKGAMISTVSTCENGLLHNQHTRECFGFICILHVQSCNHDSCISSLKLSSRGLSLSTKSYIDISRTSLLR